MENLSSVKRELDIVTKKYTDEAIAAAVENKVDKVDGKGLSTNDFTNEDKEKLASLSEQGYTLPVASSDAIGGVKSGTDITVDSSGNVSVNDNSHKHTVSNISDLDSYISGKISNPGYSDITGKPTLNGVTIEGTKTSEDYSIANAEHSHDVSDITGLTATVDELNYVDGVTSNIQTQLNNKAPSTHNHTVSQITDLSKSSIGLGNVENKSSVTIRSEITSENVTTALGYTPMNSNLKGANSGVAELDANGKVPTSQLPSYVDDVLEYSAKANFPTTGESGKIYVDLATNLTYRWSGSAYVEISPSLALGETSSTAYRGDRGKTAYDHSQVTSGNPHKVSKSDVGLGNVENKSSATIRGEITSSNVTTALGFTPSQSDHTHNSIQINRSASTGYFPILLTNTGDGVTVKQDNVYAPHGNTVGLDPKNGAIKANKFVGSGSDLTGLYEGQLVWGNQATKDSVTPLGMAISEEHAGNKAAFINGNAITIEYSTDGGSTYTDSGISATNKSALFTTSFSVPVGGNTSMTADNYTKLKTRITLTGQDGTNNYLYTDIKKMLINVSSAVSLGLLIETMRGDATSWVTYGTYSITGWSGWNDIPLIIKLGGGASQKDRPWKVRFTLSLSGSNTSYATTKSVTSFRIFGQNSWNVPHTLGKTGHMYTYDMSQNVTFPAKVTSTSFAGSGADLTSLNATQLTSGTVPAARLPKASTSALGAVKIGSGLSVDTNGVISVAGGSGKTEVAVQTTEPTDTDIVLWIDPSDAENLDSVVSNRKVYSSSTAYQPNDMVSYNGSWYICNIACTGKTPGTGEYWTPLGVSYEDRISAIETELDGLAELLASI